MKNVFIVLLSLFVFSCEKDLKNETNQNIIPYSYVIEFSCGGCTGDASIGGHMENDYRFPIGIPDSSHNTWDTTIGSWTTYSTDGSIER